MVPIRSHARRWAAYLAGGGLVLAFEATAQILPKSNPPAPSGWNTQGEEKHATGSEHQDGCCYIKLPPATPLSVKIINPQDHYAVTTKAEDDGRWYTRPDWWVAGFTGALFIATFGLWIFTALLWRATNRAVTDGESSLKAALAATAAANRHVTEAARAAKAAEGMAIVAEKDSRARLRAYVFVERLNIENFDVGQLPVIGLRIRNYGNTPAYSFKNVVNAGFFAWPPGEDMPPPPTVDGMASAVIAPSGHIETFVSPPTGISINLFRRIELNEMALYVIGKSEYVDVFGEAQETNYFLFCNALNKYTLSPNVMGNTAT